MYLNIALVSSILIIGNAAYLPAFITPCCRQSLDLSTCIFKNIEAAKPYLINGLPELSIFSLKNFIIPYSYVHRSNVEFGLWNYNISGLDNFNVLKVDADLRTNIFKFQIEFPFVEAIGSYGLKGKLFNLNFDSTGPVVGNATNLILNFELKTKLVQRNYNTYFQQEYRHVDVGLDGALYMYFHNLYLGNMDITEIMNRILNENSYYLYQVVVETFEKHLDNLLGKAVDNFFKAYTYNELLP